VFLIFSLGIAISLAQFLYNRSLWLDEASLTLNIIHSDFSGLLKPLEGNHQIAPILFLEIEKLISILIPNSELGLRIFPLICYWLSLYFFYRILKLLFANSLTIIFALSLYVFNSTLLYYSSEVKPYISDVFVLNAFLFFLFKGYKKERFKYFLLAAIGIIAVFLSNVAPIVLFTGGLYLLYLNLKGHRAQFKYIGFLSFIWAFAFFVYYYCFIYAHPSIDSQVNLNAVYDVFLPLNPFKFSFYSFIVFNSIANYNSILPFGMAFFVCAIVLLSIGFARLLKSRQIGFLIMFIAPVILHLLLSGFKLYPYDTRKILYSSILLFLLITFGFDYLFKLMLSSAKLVQFRLLLLIIPVLLLFNLLFAKKNYMGIAEFPIQHEEIKKCLDFVNQNIKDSDNIYVYYAAKNAFVYYVEINYFKAKNTYTIASWSNRGHIDKAFDDLKQLKGKNWLLFSHVHDDDEGIMVHYLDSLGYPQLSSIKAIGSSVYCYDFGDK